MRTEMNNLKKTRKLITICVAVIIMLLFLQGSIAAWGMEQTVLPEGYELTNYQVSPTPTPNSQCVITGSVSSGVKWLWVKVIKGNRQTDVIMRATGREFSRRLYLPYGAGTYRLQLSLSTSPEMYRSYYQAGEVTINNLDQRDLTYLLPTKQVQSDNSQIVALAKQITLGRKTDLEKTKAIHDWIATHIAYDTKAYFKGTAVSYTAQDTLRLRSAMCNGYANLNAALHRAVGIKAKIVSGVAIHLSKGATWKKTDKNKANHAWNEVLVNGKWIIEDTTWDAGVVNFSTQTFKFKLSNKYFNPVPAKFALDHYKLNVEQD